MKVKDLVRAISSIVEVKAIEEDVIIKALASGLEKAYRKHINNPDVKVRVEVKDDNTIHLYQLRTVVEDYFAIIDPEVEISLEEAKNFKEDVVLGDVVEEEVDIQDFGRSTVSLVKNVMLQNIKEASKQKIFDLYKDHISDLRTGCIEKCENKFILVNLGNTLAIMLTPDQIPNEKYVEGQNIKVVIKSVSKEAKGSQVVVSRASTELIRRLLEIEVDEFRNGEVEINAIAREAGERTKIAVSSHKENVDAAAAFIGTKGRRVNAVVTEINKNRTLNVHESIDIVEYSPNRIEYVKNIMAPAVIEAVIPNEETGEFLVVVDNDKLSQAIGKRGINVRLAAKLLERKVEIKTKKDLEEKGIDWYNLSLEAIAKENGRIRLEEERRQEQIAKEKAAKEEARQLALEEARKAAELLRQQQEELAAAQDSAEDDNTEVVEVIEKTTEIIENTVTKVVEKVEEVVEEITEDVEETEKETTKRRKPSYKASDYVSKYETLADAKKEEKTSTSKKKKYKSKEEIEEEQLREQLANLKNKEYEIKPEYSEEELEEFENDQEEHWYDDDSVDYDDFDDFYDKD